jgi:hypothetical protein
MAEMANSRAATQAWPAWSGSVKGLEAELSAKDFPVSAATVTNRLLETHPQYAQDQAKQFRVSENPDSQQQRVSEWLEQVARQYDPGRAPEIHGRLVILGLSRLDTHLAAELSRDNFLEILRRELREPLETLLSPLGQQLWGLPAGPEPGSARPGPGFASDRTYPHLDAPALKDELGRAPFAAALARYLRYIRYQLLPTRPEQAGPAEQVIAPGLDNSFLLHLYGPWGSGKTSLLNFLRTELEQPLDPADYPGITPEAWVLVEFNAWQHQRLDPPWWALMDAVFQQAQARLKAIDPGRARRLWWREQLWRIRTAATPWLLAVVIVAVVVFGLLVAFGSETPPAGSGQTQPDGWADRIKTIDVLVGLLILGAGTAFSISRSLLPGTANAAQTFLELTRNPLPRIARHFTELVAWVGRPVAIIIDDLDRCEAQYVVKLLEGIQTLFRGAPVVYVVAADMRWLRASYEQVYDKFCSQISEPGHPLGYLFTEKIFQLSAPIPGVLPIDRDTYWQRLVDRKEVAPEELEELKAQARQLFQAKSSDREIIEEVEKAKGTGVQELVYRAEAVKRLVSPEVQLSTENRLKQYSHLVGSNPRTMKRTVNAHTIQQQLLLITGVEIDPDVLPLWTILTVLWPHLADCFKQTPQAIGYFHDPDQDTAKKKAKYLQGIPDSLLPLFEDQDVCSVVLGEGVHGRLDEDTLRRCATLSS